MISGRDSGTERQKQTETSRSYICFIICSVYIVCLLIYHNRCCTQTTTVILCKLFSYMYCFIKWWIWLWIDYVPYMIWLVIWVGQIYPNPDWSEEQMLWVFYWIEYILIFGYKSIPAYFNKFLYKLFRRFRPSWMGYLLVIWLFSICSVVETEKLAVTC